MSSDRPKIPVSGSRIKLRVSTRRRQDVDKEHPKARENPSPPKHPSKKKKVKGNKKGRRDR